MMTFTLDFSSNLTIDDEQFEKNCHNNPDVQFEHTAQGELIIMPPVGAESDECEANIITDLMNWNRQNKSGKIFSYSTFLNSRIVL
ncbi:Uma2 family endonuclease [[Limnothrix rosea] IAM M-220]|uniref:Uma2 family endonuclease n=1 Tax=[Limnothrix rosea] IAM M-220 TaxID=454133 RepID=UPI000A02A1D2|nr:Uma2 family endonuclease [[Limnothrix rosea] IAM M-220]